MKFLSFLFHPMLVCMLTGTIWVTPVFADKPPWADKHGKANKNAFQSEVEPTLAHANGNTEVGFHAFFSDHQRNLVQDYIKKSYRKSKCPPGLAKKANGCRPPGLTKKWGVGRQLPNDVIFHNLSPRMSELLGPPPARHRYVRVAEDILLITIGVGMVIDAIEDLNWQLDH